MLVDGGEERELAAEAHDRFTRSPGLYADAALQAYVQQVGDRIVAKSERSDVDYRFFILNQPEVNALALPDGRIYVTRGMLAYLGSEAELAAVLAHEVAHVSARHSAQLISSAKVAGAVSTLLGVVAGVAVGGATGDMNLAMSSMDAAGGLSSMASVMVIGNYSRAHELEADRLGVGYLASAGYPKQAMGQVFETLQRIEKFDDERLNKDEQRHMYHRVATHPELDERLEKSAVAAVPAQEAQQSAVSDSYLQKLDGLLFEPFGEAAPVQARKDRYLNKESLLQVYIPVDWDVVESTAEMTVLEKPEDGIRNVFRLLPASAAQDPTAFFSGAPLQAKSVRDVAELTHIYHKKPGFSALVDIETEKGTRTIYAAVLYHDKYTVLLTGMPEDKEWLEKRRFVFEAQANSCRIFTQEEYDQQRLKRIANFTVTPSDSYAKLAETTPLGTDAEKYLRLLNKDYPAGELVAGRSIRIVVAEP